MFNSLLGTKICFLIFWSFMNLLISRLSLINSIKLFSVKFLFAVTKPLFFPLI